MLIDSFQLCLPFLFVWTKLALNFFAETQIIFIRIMIEISIGNVANRF